MFDDIIFGLHDNAQNSDLRNRDISLNYEIIVAPESEYESDDWMKRRIAMYTDEGKS